MQKVSNNKKALVIILSLLSGMVVVLLVVNIAIVLRQSGGSNGQGVKDCLKMEDRKEILNCINEEAFSYSYEDDCENALKVYSNVPVSQFDANELNVLYGRAYQISLSCDEKTQEYWWGKYSEILNQMDGRG